MFTTQRNFADKRKKNPVSLSVDKLLKEQYQNERTVSSTNNLFKLYFDKQRGNDEILALLVLTTLCYSCCSAFSERERCLGIPSSLEP